ncbi:hypothetical protein TVAG_264270 [Trichomonas vaginalis G3]|uniref:Uncharacterized protein n=1 Tax=Trichomonas vaginalis (strain ATCC PRA-98 / G3) TaxID=412133 RepID=A2FFM4_TRIV3|nr:RNA 2',3'-cyclic phosphodiesterase family [Trichomonas vaginalis G3]EAX96303.1 hypothetical protein TVAG_264270 [Trichomonas vaginalis G3]KAI5491262.1 RNA 2',3'-cyclic phosphodiesterase family [Trichomonas vaginalis G3]|eukprot:XP_001309233.1 hypothetical protein [Trichomonas vaginalis G3]
MNDYEECLQLYLENLGFQDFVTDENDVIDLVDHVILNKAQFKQIVKIIDSLFQKNSVLNIVNHIKTENEPLNNLLVEKYEKIIKKKEFRESSFTSIYPNLDEYPDKVRLFSCIRLSQEAAKELQNLRDKLNYYYNYYYKHDNDFHITVLDYFEIPKSEIKRIHETILEAAKKTHQFELEFSELGKFDLAHPGGLSVIPYGTGIPSFKKLQHDCLDEFNKVFKQTIRIPKPHISVALKYNGNKDTAQNAKYSDFKIRKISFKVTKFELVVSNYNTPQRYWTIYSYKLKP